MVAGEKVPAESAARALGKLAAYASWRHRPPTLFWSFDDLHPNEAPDGV
jgi:hypothetical protein